MEGKSEEGGAVRGSCDDCGEGDADNPARAAGPSKAMLKMTNDA